MNKIRAYSIFSLVLTMFLMLLSINVIANSQIEKEPIEEQYKKSGYISDKEAIEKFKNVYNQDPNINNIDQHVPFQVSISKGSFDENEQKLDLEYLNTKSRALFKVMVFPIEKEIPLGASEKIGKMEDGTPYSYQRDDKFYIFRFNSENYAYVLSSNFLGDNKNIKEKTFLEIAKEIKNQ